MGWLEDSRAALDANIRAQGIPLDGLSGFPASVGGTGMRADYGAGITPAQQSQGDSIIAGWDWSQSAQTTRATTARQAATQAQVPAIPADVTVTELKAAVMLTMDELNLLRKRLTDQDAAVAAATSLADLKSRWATVASSDPMPQRTPAQVETALQNRITSTDVG